MGPGAQLLGSRAWAQYLWRTNSCSTACGIFPDQGSNQRPLHWQADSYPLCHQGSSTNSKFNNHFRLGLSPFHGLLSVVYYPRMASQSWLCIRRRAYLPPCHWGPVGISVFTILFQLPLRWNNPTWLLILSSSEICHDLWLKLAAKLLQVYRLMHFHDLGLEVEWEASTEN